MQILQQLASAVPHSYSEHDAMASVALWTLLIAGVVVLVEWLLSRHRDGR